MEFPTATGLSGVHIRIHNQCGACGQLFKYNEYGIISINRNGSSIEVFNAFQFSGYYYAWENNYRRVRGLDEIFCKNPNCYTCRTKDNSITVHADCFHLFLQRCVVKDIEDGPARKKEIYRRLWLAGRKRYAWRGMPALNFMSSTALERPPPEMISEMCGFRRLFLPEVAQLIQHHSQSHHLWRFCSVLKLLQDLESAESLESATYPLAKVLSWSRGEEPILVQDGQEHLAGPFVELQIDGRGVMSIERISKVATNTDGEMPASSFVFAVEPVEKLGDAKMEFELGMCHLHVDPEKISIWSTPAIAQHKELEARETGRYKRFNSISLNPDCCTGISFFMRNHCIVDILAHSTRYPATHVEKFKYMGAMFNSSADDGVAWIYMPLTAKDEITAIRARTQVTPEAPHYFTFYTKTGKRIAVGTPYRETRIEGQVSRLGKDEVYTLEKDSHRHLNLLYSIPAFGQLTLIRPDAEIVTDGDADDQYTASVIDTPPTITSLFLGPRGVSSSLLPKAFFSSAPLEGILNVHVFGMWGFCKGILIEYEDGSKRALGQCRLGLDDVQSWHRPLSMHFVSAGYERNVCDLVRETRKSSSAQVTFDSESSHITEDGSLEENYYELKGRLNFWFTYNEVELQLVDG
ncbi:hypothetical protein ACQKWADRAFT_84373 [Trichoderma austrokoningii]